MVARGPKEARILGLERGLEGIDRNLCNLNRRLITASQGVWAAWSDVRLVGRTEVTATYSGTLEGCFAAGLVGQTVTLKDHGTGSTLGSVTTGSFGAFSGILSIPSGGRTVDFGTSVPGYGASTTTVTLTSGSNPIGTISLSAASGHVCTSFCGGFIASTTQTLVDSVYGPCTLTWTGTLWQGTHTGISYPGYGAGGCSAATIAITYQLLTGGNVNVLWQVNGSFCPVASGTLVSVSFGGVPSCGGSTPVITATNNSGSGELKALRAGAPSQTFTVTLV